MVSTIEAIVAEAPAASESAGPSAAGEASVDLREAGGATERHLDDLMAEVQQLEEQGRLVEASALMVELMRVRSGGGGR